MKRIICIVCITLSCSSFGYNSNACKGYLRSFGPMNPGRHMISTSSYVSSTGDCAMIGKVENDAYVFVAHNYEKIKQDFSKGRGEYSDAFVSIYGCDLEYRLPYSLLMKKKFSLLRQKESEGEDAVVSFLREGLKEVARVGKGCSGLGV